MLHERNRWMSKSLFGFGLIVYLIFAARTLPYDNQLDLFIYRTGAKIALEGRTPYNTAEIRFEVAKQFPPKNENDVALNCGFFLPPQGIAIFAPFAKVEKWSGAEAGWFFTLSAFGICCGTLAWTFGRDPKHQGSGWAIIVLVLLLNPITQTAQIVGQTGLFFAGCIAFGQYCFERGSSRLGCFLWALIFIKPHLALPFLALAWILGGWKRAAGIVFVVAILNLLGGLLVRGTFMGSVRLFQEYVEYLGSAHKTVKFNLVSENFQILSWNRIVAAVGGPAIDLKIWMILAGFALWSFLFSCRLRLSGPDALSRKRLDGAYLLAASVIGALFFAQVLAYELILLVLLAPMILQCVDNNQRWEAYLIAAILVYLMIPMTLTDQIADFFKFGEADRGRTLLRSHKCFGMAALALHLLIRGPVIPSRDSLDRRE